MTIVNYNSNIVNKFGASLTDDARVVIYECHMFIVHATDWVDASNDFFKFCQMKILFLLKVSTLNFMNGGSIVFHFDIHFEQLHLISEVKAYY